MAIRGFAILTSQPILLREKMAFERFMGNTFVPSIWIERTAWFSSIRLQITKIEGNTHIHTDGKKCTERKSFKGGFGVKEKGLHEWTQKEFNRTGTEGFFLTCLSSHYKWKYIYNGIITYQSNFFSLDLQFYQLQSRSVNFKIGSKLMFLK